MLCRTLAAILAVILLACLTPLVSAEEWLIDADFEQDFAPSNAQERARGRAVGRLPLEVLQDDSSWADVDVTYRPMSRSAHGGGRALEVDVHAVRDGNAQLRCTPQVPLRTDRVLRVSAALRSPTSSVFRIGLRDIGSPYRSYWQQTVTAAPEWREVEFLVPPIMNNPKVQLFFYLDTAGVFQLDDLRVVAVPLDEFSQDADFQGNLLPSSSFPHGVQAPWLRQYYLRTDRGVTGPTGSPALRVEPRPSGERHVAKIVAPFVGKMGEPHTLSLYARSSQPGQTLFMRMGPPSESLHEAPWTSHVTLGEQWERHAFTTKLPFTSEGFFVVNILTHDPATFWIDGLQVEVGQDMGPFERPARVEVSASVTAPAGVFLEQEPVQVTLASVGGPLTHGRIEGRLIDVYGDDKPVGPWPTPAPGAARRVTLPEAGVSALGTYRLVVKAYEGDEAVSEPAEVMFHRVREPRRFGEPAPDSPFGLHLRAGDREMAEAASRLGFKWVRLFGPGWHWFEPEQGRFKPDAADEVMRIFHEADLRVLAILGGTPMWAAVEPGKKPIWQAWVPADLAGFGRYAAHVAGRYADTVLAVESWNEPFWPRFMPRGYEDGRFIHATPQQFAQVHQTAWQAVRSAGVDTAVLWNSGGSNMPDWEQAVIDLGVPAMLDAVSIHHYSRARAGFPGDNVETTHLRAIREKLPQAGESLPIWDTEWGPGPVDYENFYASFPPFNRQDRSHQRADFLVRGYVSRLVNGIAKSFVYTHMDGSEWRNDYSLLNADGAVSPNTVAVSNLIWHLEGTAFNRHVDLGRDHHAYVFTGEGRGVIVVLSNGTDRYTVAQPPAGVTVRDLYGNQPELPYRAGRWPLLVTTPDDGIAEALGWLQQLTRRAD